MIAKHFYPDCMVLIVPGFQSNQIDTSESMVFSNYGQIKEVQSVSVNLTVANNPGTFNIVLSDTANRYLQGDDPEKEIKTLWDRSQSLTKDVLKGVNNANFSGANYYEFDGYDSGENPWTSFDHFSLEDGYGRYPIQYRNDINNNIVERWAFTNDGRLIQVMPTGTADSIKDLVDSSSFSCKVYDMKNSKSNTQEFTLHRHENNEFNTKYRDIEEQGEDTKLFKRGRCRISSMDRVVIFMSKRFETGVSESKSEDNQGRELTRVFTGFVNSVQEGYSENNNTITIQGEDVTKLMRLSVVNVNPSLLSNKNVSPDRSSEDDITLYTDILKNLKPPEIIEYLTVGGTFNSGAGIRKIKGTGYWEISPVVEDKIHYDIVIKFDEKGNRVIERVPKNTKDAIELEKIRGKNSKASIATFKEILGDLFTPSKVHIINPFIHKDRIEGYRAYELAFNTGNYQLFQNDFQVKRDIAYKVAEDTAFTFYADRNGDVWYCPPRYNNSHIFSAENPEVYIIRSEDIISYGFIEDDAKIFSTVTVSTDPDWEYAGSGMINLGAYVASVRDENILLQYGQRIFTYSNPLINTKGTYVDKSGTKDSDMLSKNHKVLQMYAKNLMQKLMAENHQGQITITGRAELAPGYPVYIPIRNSIYYVETVTHNFSFGGRYETTLHLTYGRKPWENVPEILFMSSNDSFGGSLNSRGIGSKKIDSKARKSSNPININDAGK